MSLPPARRKGNRMREEGIGKEMTSLPGEIPATVVPPPCLLIIFGASGDLTKRKLVPALFGLYREKLLPEEFAVLAEDRIGKPPRARD